MLRLSHLTWELPNYIPFDATKEFILQCVQHWEAPMRHCFDVIHDNTHDHIGGLISMPEHFGRFSELDAFVRLVYDFTQLTFIF